MWTRQTYPWYKVTAWILVATLVIGIPIWVMAWYNCYVKTDALIDRAQVAADAADMLDYMQQVQTNLKSKGMDQGYISMIKSPISDMALHYRAIEKINERLMLVKQMPKDTTTYQVALDDIRGTIRELPNPATGWVWVHGCWVFLLIWLILIILSVVGLMIDTVS